LRTQIWLDGKFADVARDNSQGPTAAQGATSAASHTVNWRRPSKSLFFE
jgi:hypothetical protein